MMALPKFLKLIVTKINSNDHAFLFWTTLIFYFISLFNLNNKTIFLSLLALWFIYNQRFRDIRQTLVYTCVVSLIFLVGKTWIVQLISPDFLLSSDYPRGYISVVVITPLHIMVTFIFAFILRDFILNQNLIRKKIKEIFLWSPTIFIYAFFMWQLMAAFLVNNMLNLPIIYALLAFSYFILFIGMILYLKKTDQVVLSILGAMMVFEAVLSVIQFIKRSTLGVPIEAISSTLSYYRGVDEGFFSVRSVGTFSHPNELAVFGILTLPIFLPFLYMVANKLVLAKSYYYVFCLSGVVVLIGSLGRSAWLSFLACLVIFLYVVEKKLEKHFINVATLKKDKKKIWYGAILVLVFIFLVMPRMVKLPDVFKPSGGGESRLRLISESLEIIKTRFLWGTGMGLSGLVMFNSNPEGSIVSTFPAVVHNYYLLIASESGILALTFFFILQFTLFKKVIERYKISTINDKIYLMGLTVSLIALLINSMAQQIVLLGFLMVLIRLFYEKTS